jgi:hypothetical protein
LLSSRAASASISRSSQLATAIFLRKPHGRGFDGWPDPHVRRGHFLSFFHVSLQLLIALAAI